MKLPNNYEAVIKAAKEKSKGKDKINKLKPISKKILKVWDKLSDTEKEIIRVGMKDFEELVEQLREIV